MSVLLHVSFLDDILDAIAETPEHVVERPHPPVELGETVSWEGIRIVHWRVSVPDAALIEIVPQVAADGEAFTTRSALRRGYAIEADGGRWAIVGVSCDEELYEESVMMVAEVVPL